MTDVLQEKARPWRDPAVEYLLESTKDWSDKRRQQGIRKERKREAVISKLQHYASSFLSKHSDRLCFCRHSSSVHQGNKSRTVLPNKGKRVSVSNTGHL